MAGPPSGVGAGGAAPMLFPGSFGHSPFAVGSRAGGSSKASPKTLGNDPHDRFDCLCFSNHDCPKNAREKPHGSELKIQTCDFVQGTLGSEVHCSRFACRLHPIHWDEDL